MSNSKDEIIGHMNEFSAIRKIIQMVDGGCLKFKQSLINEAKGQFKLMEEKFTSHKQLNVDKEEIVYGGYTWNELKEAFNKVCNKENWKLPIEKVEVDRDKLRVTEFAIAFFVGEFPVINMNIKDDTVKPKVSSKGYYVICGA